MNVPRSGNMPTHISYIYVLVCIFQYNYIYDMHIFQYKCGTHTRVEWRTKIVLAACVRLAFLLFLIKKYWFIRWNGFGGENEIGTYTQKA